MLRNLKEFYYPTSVPEALAILGRFESRAAVVAGCTSLGRVDDAKLEAAVDITRLGLSYVKETKEYLELGAATTYETMARSRKLQGFAGGLLAEAASRCGSHLIRNVMTLGGSIIISTPGAELPPALLALDARMLIAGATEQEVPAAEFFSQPKFRLLGRLELLTAVRIPRELEAWSCGYELFARTRTDPSMGTAAVLLASEGDTCSGARVVFGGICRHATRSTAAEKKLLGKRPGPIQFDAAAKAALKDLEVVSDWRASKEYRVHAAHVLMKRTLAACWARAIGGSR
ncbi:MAG: FAD binding domain-containing protein [Candidatus Riflebacteria bacterium]|nr:FAD binding domain-containing protein [Candidatus Riflebacteria bacterium]